MEEFLDTLIRLTQSAISNAKREQGLDECTQGKIKSKSAIPHPERPGEHRHSIVIISFFIYYYWLARFLEGFWLVRD
jgi:hypothetical protein